MPNAYPGDGLDEQKKIDIPAERLIISAYMRIINKREIRIPEISQDCVSGVKQVII